MVNWEFAAIVFEDEMWFLVKPAEVEPLRCTVSANNQSDEQGPVFKWHSPMNWGEGLDKMNRTMEEYNESVRNNQKSPYKHLLMKIKSNDLSEPNILYNSEDILTLVNMAGANGWEITGGLGLAGNEKRWRMMRREL